MRFLLLGIGNDLSFEIASIATKLIRENHNVNILNYNLKIDNKYIYNYIRNNFVNEIIIDTGCYDKHIIIMYDLLKELIKLFNIPITLIGSFAESIGDKIVISDKVKVEVIDYENSDIDYSLLDLRQYVNNGVFNRIRTSYGCCYSCRFCVNSRKKTGYYDIKKIENWIRQIKEKTNCRSIFILDNMTFYKLDRLRYIVDLFKKYDLKISCIDIRPEQVTDDFIDLMKGGVIEYIFMGSESFSDNELIRMNKKTDSFRIKNGLNKLKKLGIKYGTSIIIGLPDMSLYDLKLNIRESVNLIKKHKDLTLLFHYYIPIYNTEYFNKIYDKDSISIDDIINMASKKRLSMDWCLLNGRIKNEDIYEICRLFELFCYTIKSYRFRYRRTISWVLKPFFYLYSKLVEFRLRFLININTRKDMWFLSHFFGYAPITTNYNL